MQKAETLTFPMVLESGGRGQSLLTAHTRVELPKKRGVEK
jgi:hypothetical protein